MSSLVVIGQQTLQNSPAWIGSNDFLNGLLKNNGVKNRLYFDATVLGKRYHSEDLYGAHPSKDGTTISLIDKRIAEVNDRLFRQ